MATVRKELGPEDDGLELSFEEYMAANYQEGYHYELIDERLYVSPHMNVPQAVVDHWLFFKLHYYEQAHPEVINYVASKALVRVPKRTKATVVGPSIVAYRNIPLERTWTDLQWTDISPLVVVEVLCIDDPEKDTVRNVELYLQVPSIKEYWLVDTRDRADRPTIRFHQKYRKRWRITDMKYGEQYTTRLLPGFVLEIDPRR
jgi:Uma2 family endonuclease